MGVVCSVLPRISLFFPALVHDAAGSGRITERWQWQGLVLVRLEATHNPPFISIEYSCCATPLARGKGPGKQVLRKID